MIRLKSLFSKNLLKSLLIGLYIAALIIPGYVFFSARHGLQFLTSAHFQAMAQLIFPLFGLYAFSFVTMQVLLATNLWWLQNIWPKIIHYHRLQGIFALSFATLHPMLILIGFGLLRVIKYKFVTPHQVIYVLFAETAWVIMATTVITALLAWHGVRIPFWRQLHRLNYLVFVLVWLHSWFIGTDVRSTILKEVWLVYLVLVIISVAGRYRSVFQPAKPVKSTQKS